MKPFQLLFVAFLAIPLLEIYMLLKIGSIIGVLATVVLVVSTAVIGAAMLRMQGFATWQRLQQALSQGKIPAMEMIEGPILLVGGALLLTPGFFTDILGFICLIPQTRKRLANSILAKGVMVNTDQSAPGEKPVSHTTIEGEYRKEED
ncbi:MAG: FxsA family protein [Methylococcales bacterium]